MSFLKVSIITVCLNSEKYIEQTIKSVLGQTYKDIEYIVVDGMSTDNTLTIIEKYKPLFGRRLKVISEKDNGLYDAMNKGIKHATGEIIGIINSDDWYEPSTVESVMEAYNKEEDAIIYGAMIYIHNDKFSHFVFRNYNELPSCMISHPTVFVPKKFYYEFGFFNEKYKIAADYDFMLRLYKNQIKFKFIPKVLANFRMGGISESNIEKCDKETLQVIRDNGYSNDAFKSNWSNEFCIAVLKKELIKRLKKINSNKIYIYGTGTHTKNLIESFPNDLRKKISGIIDKEPDENNKYVYGYKKITIEQVEKSLSNSIVISSLTYEDEIYNRIKHLSSQINVVRIYGADSVEGINELISHIIIE